MIKTNKKLNLFIYLILLLLFSFCSNTEKLKSKKTNPNSEATILEKEKQLRQDSLENLRKEIQLLKKKKEALINANKKTKK